MVIYDGTKMLMYIEKSVLSKCRTPIQTESARKAVPFLEKNGDVCMEGPFECVCTGSPLFSTLYNMQKSV